MKNSGICIAASLIGGMLIGSALTLLFTPKSGPEVRRQLRDLVDDEKKRMRRKAGEVREALDEIRSKEAL